MNEMITPRRSIGPKKNRSNGSTIQLTFHIPEGMREKTKLTVENCAPPEMLEELKKIEAFKIVDALKKIETLKAVENLDVAEIKYAPDIVPVSLPISEEKAEPSKGNEKLHINDLINDVVPFLSLKLKNQPMVYKIGTSYLQDIDKGHKHFGFATLAMQKDDLHLLVYGGFINYSLRQPVLIVVRDINDKSLDKYRSNFTNGTLWKWKTHDWGNLCFIDHKQINKYSDEFSKLDLNFITNEFAAVLWSLPSTNVQDELQKASLPILGKLDSITLIINKGDTKSKEVKKSMEYFQCFDVALKGILMGEGSRHEFGKKA